LLCYLISVLFTQAYSISKDHPVTKPIEELLKVAVALQALVGDRAAFELFEDPVSHAALLKVDQDSQFASRILLKTSDIRHFPLKLITLLSADPEEQNCETHEDLDAALAAFVSSDGMHQLLRAIMTT
jgi:hypothetical protein